MNNPSSSTFPTADARSLLKALRENFRVFRDCKQQEEARQLEAAERERSEKLGQLVAKFSRWN
jgi:hypothetical protein